MALRVSIGAGRWRLIQLVLSRALLLAVIASAVGALFACVVGAVRRLDAGADRAARSG